MERFMISAIAFQKPGFLAVGARQQRYFVQSIIFMMPCPYQQADRLQKFILSDWQVIFETEKVGTRQSRYFSIE